VSYDPVRGARGQIKGDLLPIFRAEVYMKIANLSGPLFLRHPESESPAVLVLVNSRLAANSQAISCGVLSP